MGLRDLGTPFLFPPCSRAIGPWVCGDDILSNHTLPSFVLSNRQALAVLLASSCFLSSSLFPLFFEAHNRAGTLSTPPKWVQKRYPLAQTCWTVVMPRWGATMEPQQSIFISHLMDQWGPHKCGSGGLESETTCCCNFSTWMVVHLEKDKEKQRKRENATGGGLFLSQFS